MRKHILYITLTILLLNIVNAEKYFVLDINHISGSLTFNSINLRDVDASIKYPDKSGFFIKSVSFKDADIFSFYYSIPDNKNYFVYIPYSKDTSRIEVFNQKNSKVMYLDVSSFADTCGNGACEPHESYESCVRDCSSGSKDDFCDGLNDGICDDDCSEKTDIDCRKKEGNATAISNIEKTGKKQNQPKAAESNEISSYLTFALPILPILFILSLIILIKKRKENKIVESLGRYITENLNKGYTLQQIKNALFSEGYSEKEIEKAVKLIY